MYSSFTIQNFRGFEEIEFKDLARINLISGENNIGKTSVLEALMLLSGDIYPLFSPRNDVQESDGTQIFPDLRLFFWKLDVARDVKITASYDQEEHSAGIHWADLKSGYPDVLKLLSHMQNFEIDENTQFIQTSYKRPHESGGIYIVKHQNKNRFLPTDGLKSRYPFTLVRAEQNIHQKAKSAYFSNIKRARKEELLLDALKIIESRLISLELLDYGGISVIHGDIGLDEPIPLIAMGEGINRVASIILAIGNTSDGVVCIDEIENGLHHSILKDVWKAIGVAAREFDVQIFATTHSLECIDAAHQAFSEDGNYDFRYHRIDRRKSGQTVVVTFGQELLQNAKEANFEVR